MPGWLPSPWDWPAALASPPVTEDNVRPPAACTKSLAPAPARGLSAGDCGDVAGRRCAKPQPERLLPSSCGQGRLQQPRTCSCQAGSSPQHHPQRKSGSSQAMPSQRHRWPSASPRGTPGSLPLRWHRLCQEPTPPEGSSCWGLGWAMQMSPPSKSGCCFSELLLKSQHPISRKTDCYRHMTPVQIHT